MGNKTDAELTRIIQEQINKATGALTNALESISGTSKGIGATLDSVKSEISIFVNDLIQPNYQTDRTRGLKGGPPAKIPNKNSNYEKYLKATKGKDISFADWLKRGSGGGF